VKGTYLHRGQGREPIWASGVERECHTSGKRKVKVGERGKGKARPCPRGPGEHMAGERSEPGINWGVTTGGTV